MKINKFILPLIPIATIGASIAPMVSCSETNKVELITDATSKVAAASQSTFFKFKQTNISSPEATKVKISKLYIGSAEAKPVEGLIKYKADSAGNIIVTFDIDLAKSHYGSGLWKISFDLDFNNAEANTTYTISDLAIEVDKQQVAVNTHAGEDDDHTDSYVYFVGDNPGSTLGKEDIVVKYYFDDGYELNTLRVMIGQQNRTENCTITESQVTIPAIYIDADITVYVTSTPSK